MIYTECFNDSELLNFLGYDYVINYDHSFGKNNVLNAMYGSQVSLGIIDEDPDSVNPYPELDSYQMIESRYGLTLFKHTDRPNFHLLEFQDELEPWLLGIAQNLGLPVGQYEVIGMNGKFKKRFKTVHEKNNFKEFLSAISSHSSFEQLKTWIQEHS